MGYGPGDQMLNPHQCLPTTAVHWLLKLKLNIDQVKEVLRLPSIKSIGGQRLMRLIANWMDSEVAPGAKINPVDQLDNLLPLVDIPSITESSMWNFMCENHVIITNQECRLFPPTFLVLRINWD